MKDKIINITLLIICFLIPVLPVLAQPPTLPSLPGAPIDGGLSILLVAGAGYGIKKVREKRQNSKEKN